MAVDTSVDLICCFVLTIKLVNMEHVVVCFDGVVNVASDMAIFIGVKEPRTTYSTIPKVIKGERVSRDALWLYTEYGGPGGQPIFPSHFPVTKK